MRKVLAMVFMTLDGVAEFPLYGTEEDPVSGDQEDPMWQPRMASIDTLLLGRVAYEKWYGHWPARKDAPDAGEWERGFARFADGANKLVFSRTLRTADWANSTVVGGDLVEEMARLRSLPGKDIALGGGPRLLQSFLERGLVDELLLTVFPSLLGRGKPLFHVVDDPENPGDFVPMGAPGRRDFRVVEAKPLPDGTVFLHYRRAPDPSAP